MKISRGLFACVAVSALLLTACSSAVVSVAQGRVTTGMKPDQVESILGRPTRIDESDTTGATGKVYLYVNNDGWARVIFVNDTVFKIDFVRGNKFL
jgi:hypothetical protein